MKYLIESLTKSFTLEVTYEEGQFLKMEVVEGELKGDFTFPVYKEEVDFLAYVKKMHKDNYTALPDVLPTFEDFWKAYKPIAEPTYNGNPDRGRAEQVWDKLKDHDKFAAVRYLKKYAKQVKPFVFVGAKYAKVYLREKTWLQKS